MSTPLVGGSGSVLLIQSSAQKLRNNQPRTLLSYLDAMNPSWHLENADPIAAASKYTFYKPSRRIIATLAPGHICRLIFAFDSDDPTYPAAERMWVLILEIDNGRFSGTLTNQPVYIKDLHIGDEVEFGPEHIIDLDVPDDEPDLAAQYAGKCLATRRIIDEHQRVGYLYREEPLPGKAAGQQDSGWRLMEGDEEQAYIDDPANLDFVSLGAILNHDDAFVHLLDEPVGSAFALDPDTGAFERVE